MFSMRQVRTAHSLICPMLDSLTLIAKLAKTLSGADYTTSHDPSVCKLLKIRNQARIFTNHIISVGRQDQICYCYKSANMFRVASNFILSVWMCYISYWASCDSALASSTSSSRSSRRANIKASPSISLKGSNGCLGAIP